MKTLVLISLTYSFIFACPVRAEDTAKLFDQYQVDSIYSGKVHPVVLATKEDRHMRTVLRDATSEQRVEFAGHYILVIFGCGTTCLQGAAIDAVTGKVVWFPFKELSFTSTDFWNPVSYCRNSRLILFKGTINSSSEDARNYNAYNYYELRDDKFVLVKTVPHPNPYDGYVGDPPKWTDTYSSEPEFCHPTSETPRNYAQ